MHSYFLDVSFEFPEYVYIVYTQRHYIYLLLSLLLLHMILCYLEMLVEWTLLTAVVRILF